jgi:hypothetical protein
MSLCDILYDPNTQSDIRVALALEKIPWFFEIAESLVDSLNANGYCAVLVVDDAPKLQARWSKSWALYKWIVMTPELFTQLPMNSIAYNFEQLDARSSHVHAQVIDAFVDVCKTAGTVWDFSSRNNQFWASRNVKSVVVPLTYTPRMTYPYSISGTHDKCLFIGNVYGRRVALVNDLREALGSTFEVVESAFSYGDSRGGIACDDKKLRAIASAAVVVNIKPIDPALTCLETSRLMWCVANRILVVSEIDEDHEARAFFKSVGVVFVPMREIIKTVQVLMNESPQRRLQRAEEALVKLRSIKIKFPSLKF